MEVKVRFDKMLLLIMPVAVHHCHQSLGCLHATAQAVICEVEWVWPSVI